KPSSTIARLKSKARKKWKNTKRKTLRSVFAVSAFRRPADGSNILFASEARPNMQGNLKAVHDRMLERGLDSQFNFGYSSEPAAPAAGRVPSLSHGRWAKRIPSSSMTTSPSSETWATETSRRSFSSGTRAAGSNPSDTVASDSTDHPT